MAWKIWVTLGAFGLGIFFPFAPGCDERLGDL